MTQVPAQGEPPALQSNCLWSFQLYLLLHMVCVRALWPVYTGHSAREMATGQLCADSSLFIGLCGTRDQAQVTRPVLQARFPLRHLTSPTIDFYLQSANNNHQKTHFS